MKYVVKNPYHLWAHQSQGQARNASQNRSFVGRNAYSYSTIVATIHEDKNGEKLYLLTSRTYSATTNRQMGEIARAIPDGRLVIRVPYVQANVQSEHRENIRHLWEKVAKHNLSSTRARIESHKEWNLRFATETLAEIGQYITFFKLKGYKKPTPEDITKATNNLRAIQIREAIELRKAKAEEEERARLLRIELQGKVDAWISGDTKAVVPYAISEAFLRIAKHDCSPSGRSIVVETSKGAEVPLYGVLRAIPRVIAAIEAQKEVILPRDTPIRLGHFTLDKISANGTVHVGCHYFLKDEILRFAAVVDEFRKANTFVVDEGGE